VTKKIPERHRPFKKASRYDSVKEAQADGNVSPELAQTRMKAQTLGKKIHKEGIADDTKKPVV